MQVMLKLQWAPIWSWNITLNLLWLFIPLQFYFKWSVNLTLKLIFVALRIDIHPLIRVLFSFNKSSWSISFPNSFESSVTCLESFVCFLLIKFGKIFEYVNCPAVLNLKWHPSQFESPPCIFNQHNRTAAYSFWFTNISSWGGDC